MATAAKKTRAKPGPKPKNGNGENPEVPAGGAPAKSNFKFELRGLVQIRQSGEQGEVRARGEWATGNVSYYVSYTTKASEYREAWIDQDMLEVFKERRKRAAKAAA